MSNQSQIFAEIGDENRIKIIEILAEKEMSVTEILHKVNSFKKGAKLTQPNLSQHLRRLKYAGIVERSRKGQTFIYSLKKDFVIKQVQRFLENISQSPKNINNQKVLL